MASEQGHVKAGMAPEMGKWCQISVKTASKHCHSRMTRHTEWSRFPLANKSQTAIEDSQG
jgi:hypothetical protein